MTGGLVRPSYIMISALGSMFAQHEEDPPTVNAKHSTRTPTQRKREAGDFGMQERLKCLMARY